MTLRRYLDWKHWLRGLWKSAIGGGASSAIGAGGLVGGNLIGADVQPIDMKQFGALFLSSTIVHGVIYLKANPFPEEVEETIATPAPFPKE